ncbi:MAG: NAD(+)/NADH kinase [Deltaproteobacteria bacterium]|nr:NAD(+)/NADH kinase [Deltaproteobacteria bacterium]MBW2009161.1 NAD(+)/NADH kinase [Deltaproteobacteria bacterium]MBW2104121.1 NAD(+)/NADH kinase [Deltaproteobacteria bacterium]MBW2349241.1 NAD(+)/NADH kinase [Deltaproteobacteria bacterium]
MKSLGIIHKHQYTAAREEARKLASWLTARGMEVFVEEMKGADTVEGCLEEMSGIPPTVQGVVVLGGDGTLLGAARSVGRYGVPILGVNLGGLGFLTMVPLDRLYDTVERMIEGGLESEDRIMLEVAVSRDGTETCHFQVLNDVVINKGTLARIIDLDVSINGDFLTTFRADGLIIATPTGSTAYNLSAGGPILYPTMENVILTPICPFTLTNRPIIIPHTSTVGVTLGKQSEEAVMLTFDGQVGFDFHYGDTVTIYLSRDRITLVKPVEHSYFDLLRTKLMWGGTTYNNHGDDR